MKCLFSVLDYITLPQIKLGDRDYSSLDCLKILANLKANAFQGAKIFVFF